MIQLTAGYVGTGGNIMAVQHAARQCGLAFICDWAAVARRLGGCGSTSPLLLSKQRVHGHLSRWNGSTGGEGAFGVGPGTGTAVCVWRKKAHF